MSNADVPRPESEPAPARDRQARAAGREGRQLVAARRRVRRRRTTVIRRRIAAGSITLFLGLWAVIFMQMVSGHDPALARRSANAAGAHAATITTTSSSADNEPASSGPETMSQSGSASESSGAVTTGQS
jgi:hypothetical protein